MGQDNLTGHTLGQYTILERLGRGGMADVYKAFHPRLEVFRAIKVIRPEFVTSADFRVRFEKEAQAVAALRHPNIVQIHDFGEQEDAYYMVMEFVRGQDLKHLIQTEGRIQPIDRAVHIVDQVAEGLHYAHAQGLIHRDIKPENIMINEDGLPILMDFGIAKLLTGSTQLTQTGLGIGTPAYMAPEQAKALPEIGPAADIYSLTVVLYEMLTGQTPYSADTPMAVALKAINDPIPLPRRLSPDISENLQQVLIKGLAKEANHRYTTVKQMQEALRSASSVTPPLTAQGATEILESQGAPEESGAEKRGGPGPAMGRYVLFGLAAIALAAIGITAYFALQQEAGQNSEPPELAQNGSESTEPAPDHPVQSAKTETSKSDVPVEVSTKLAGRQVTTKPSQTSGLPEQAENQSDQTEPATATETSKSDVQTEASTKLVEQQLTTEPGKASTYTVEAKQGDVVYLRIFEATETTKFTLGTPDGHRQVFEAYDSYGPVTLNRTGRYTLSALTPGEAPANVDFALWRLKPAVIDAGILAFGHYTQGHTTTPGQAVTYAIEGQSGQTLYFELAEASESTEFILTAPDGRTQLFDQYDDSGPVTLKQSGAYTLRADPHGAATSAFEFAVWNVEPYPIEGGTVAFGHYTQGRTTIPGQAVSYTLEAKAGQTLYFELSKASECTEFILTAPDGRTQLFDQYDDFGPVTLKQSGAYTLRADPRGAAISDFEFALWKVDPYPIEGGTVAFGQYTQGHTTIPGQAVTYSIEAQSGQTLYFEVTEASASTEFVLTAPDGRTQLFDQYDDFGPVTLKQSGAYTLRADPRGAAISDFEFMVRSEK